MPRYYCHGVNTAFLLERNRARLKSFACMDEKNPIRATQFVR
jgi:hypothetical protein